VLLLLFCGYRFYCRPEKTFHRAKQLFPGRGSHDPH